VQARHLHVTVSQGFGGAPRSFSQACFLHVHHTFFTEPDRTVAADRMSVSPQKINARGGGRGASPHWGARGPRSTGAGLCLAGGGTQGTRVE